MALGAVLLWGSSLSAQVYWDGSSGNFNWNSSSNWTPSGVPVSTTNVILDNTYVATLPSIALQGHRAANSLTFSTGNTFAIVDGTSGARTLTLTSGDITRTSGSSGTQSISNANLNLQGDGAFNINGTGRLTINSILGESGAGAANVVKSGDGTLVLAGANTITAGLSVTGGTLQVASDANLGNSANDITLAGGTLSTTGSFTAGSGRVLTIGAGGGTLDVASGQTLTLGTAGQLAGSGTLTKTGAGTLALTALPDFADILVLQAGTLRLSDISLTLDTLTVTGNSTIDFGGANATLNVANLSVAAGVTLNIINWANAADYFFASNWLDGGAGAGVYDTGGANPMNQVVFASFSAADTQWKSYGAHEITPVPEPRLFGALVLALTTGLVLCRRLRVSRRPA